jgi:hypothetical protein
LTSIQPDGGRTGRRAETGWFGSSKIEHGCDRRDQVVAGTVAHEIIDAAGSTGPH